MNIKSMNINTSSALDTVRRTEATGVRTEVAAQDRDADGRRDREAATAKAALNDQEFEDALKVLAETPGLKANNLSISVDVDGNARVVFILAPDGMVVRRLTDAQLWAATRDRDRSTGNMLNKKM